MLTLTARQTGVSGQCRSPRPPWRAVDCFRPRGGSASPFCHFLHWCLLFVLIRQGEPGGHEPPRLIRRWERRQANEQGPLDPTPENSVFRCVLGPNILREPFALTLSLALPNPLSPLLVTRRHTSSRNGGHALTSFRDQPSGPRAGRVLFG